MFMKKNDLAEIVHEMLGGTKVQAEEVVSKIFDTITDSLAGGKEVDIAGFGKFVVNQQAARTARNPRTGEAVKVAAKRSPKFKAAKRLKDAVN